MPRIRTIKPEFWGDEKLSHLDPITRLVFLGLISLADDAGRLVDNLKQLDGQLFPSTSDSCRQPLETLASLKRIVRYRSASGQDLIQIAKWSDHQKVDNPSRYVLPAPPSRKPRDNNARLSRQSRVPTLDLGPTTNDQRPEPRTAAKKRTALPAPESFAEAWSLYPRRTGSNPRIRAERAWRARVAEGVSPADLIAGVRRYLSHCEAEHKLGTPYVLQAATFFGPERRWAEEFTPSNGRDSDDERVERMIAEEEAAARSTQELIARRRGHGRPGATP